MVSKKSNARQGEVGLRQALMIVPTYNEVKNTPTLLKALFALDLARIGWELHVMVRDDHSPDGTGDVVRSLAQTDYKGKLLLSEGKKMGLGKALQKSFDKALTYDYEVIMTMDADFSHSPSDVPHLLEAINDGADVAIGSRYVEGGLIPGNWPIGLIIRTRVAAMVARLLGGIDPQLQELTTNFRAMHRSVLEKIGYNDVQAKGYGFQIFLANSFTQHDFVLKEVPISFYSRAHGNSKAKTSDIVEFFKIAYKLNDDSPVKQVIRFMAVGLSGTIINLLSLFMLRTITGNDSVVLSLLAIQVSIFWNFTLHSFFTFRRYKRATRQQRTVGTYLKNFIKYQAASSLTQAIIFIGFIVFSNLWIFYLFAQALGISLAVIINYYLSSTFIWSISRKYA